MGCLKQWRSVLQIVGISNVFLKKAPYDIQAVPGHGVGIHTYITQLYLCLEVFPYVLFSSEQVWNFLPSNF